METLGPPCAPGWSIELYSRWVLEDPTSSSATAAELLVSVAPSDDSGADTADRYDWQAAMAAADGLALYCKTLNEGTTPSDSDRRVLCELHEDWVLQEGNDVELVSGKHREQSVATFTTVNMLADAGGLAHLFDRWSVMREQPTCRLVTTGGLGSGDPQSLVAAATYFKRLRLSGTAMTLDDERRALVGAFRDSIAKYSAPVKKTWDGTSGGGAIPLDDRSAEVARFLSMLHIDHGKPGRHHIGYSAPSQYAKPVLDQLEVGATASARVVVAVWEAVMNLFRARMRARGPVPWAGLPELILGRPIEESFITAQGERSMRERIITMEDIEIVIETAIAQPTGFMPVTRVPRSTRLAVKMATGGCTDNAIERAEELRQDYKTYWRDRQSGDPTARSEQSKLQRRLMRISDDASTSGLPGAIFWKRVQERVDNIPADQLPSGMDPDLALGGICDLTNECKVWFSDRFDVAARIVELHAQRDAQS